MIWNIFFVISKHQMESVSAKGFHLLSYSKALKTLWL